MPPAGRTISYSEFKTAVRSGQVAEVTVGEQAIRGVYTRDVNGSRKRRIAAAQSQHRELHRPLRHIDRAVPQLDFSERLHATGHLDAVLRADEFAEERIREVDEYGVASVGGHQVAGVVEFLERTEVALAARHDEADVGVLRKCQVAMLHPDALEELPQPP